MVSFTRHLALTLIFGCSAYAIKYPDGWKPPRLQSLRDMLSTREKIWLTMRTYDVPYRDCIYWLNNGMTKNEYDFYYWQRRRPKASEWHQGGSKLKVHRYAKLGYKGRWPAMIVRDYSKTEKEARTDRLIFWSESEKCFILELPDGNCEQHTWQSNIWKTHECDNVFFALCGAWNYPVFRKSCIDPNAICVGLTTRC
uniref:Lipocalin n=1 Tax=Rhipicephalus zambeziensis TaxID=60191 RepID=A0A224YHV5_9ACAR